MVMSAMKKTFLLIGCLALLVAGCSKEKDVEVPTENPQEETNRHLTVNITVNQEDPETRAVKTDWEAGDKVYVVFDDFFSDASGQKEYYMTLTYNGEKWESTISEGALEAYLLDHPSGKLAAAYTAAGFPGGEEPQFEYHPQDNRAASRLEVTNATPGFVLAAESYPYSVENDILTATLNMTLMPWTEEGKNYMVHFFIDGVSESDASRYSFQNDHIRPTYLNGFFNLSWNPNDPVGSLMVFPGCGVGNLGGSIPADYYQGGIRFCGMLDPDMEDVSAEYVIRVIDNGGTPENTGDDILYIYTPWNNVRLKSGKSVKLPELGPDSKWERIELGSAITFKSAIVKEIAVHMWDTSGDGELSYAEAAAVTSLGRAFSAISSDVIPDELKQRLVAENAPFSFNELQYFTGLTGIEERAFMETKNLTAITLPSSITSIGDYAFSGCGLYANSDETIVIPEGVKRIGERAFEANPFFEFNLPASVTEIYGNTFLHCPMLSQINVSSDNPVYENPLGRNSIVEKSTHTLIVGGRQTDIVDGVKKIGPYAFCGREFNWTVLENNEMVFPDSVVEIGEGAFYQCLGLKSIKLGSGLKSIGDMAFDACVELGYLPSNPKPLVIPGNVESIGKRAFNTCGIMLLTLENGVKTIGEQAFFSCSFLRTVEIPSSVESIGKEAFYCEGFESIADLAATPQPYAEEMLGSVDKTFPIYVPGQSIAAYKQAWPDYANRIVGLGNIEFASSVVKGIAVNNWDTNHDGELSYAEAAAVTSLEGKFSNSDYDNPSIPRSTEYTFDELQFFTGLTSIGDHEFERTSLTSVILPPTIESIGYSAFGFTKITSIVIPENVTKFSHFVFEDTPLQSIHIPAKLTSMMSSPVTHCANLSSITVSEDNPVYASPNGCNAIIVKATNTLFAGCSSTVIPETVTSIGVNAFSGAENLKSIEIPGTVEEIRSFAFAYSGLQSVSIGNRVETIGSYAFYECDDLETVVIPQSVESIGEKAFADSGLQSVYDLATAPQAFSENMFGGASDSYPIYVPEACVSAYKREWQQYADRIQSRSALDPGFSGFKDEITW